MWLLLVLIALVTTAQGRVSEGRPLPKPEALKQIANEILTFPSTQNLPWCSIYSKENNDKFSLSFSERLLTNLKNEAQKANRCASLGANPSTGDFWANGWNIALIFIYMVFHKKQHFWFCVISVLNCEQFLYKILSSVYVRNCRSHFNRPNHFWLSRC